MGAKVQDDGPCLGTMSGVPAGLDALLPGGRGVWVPIDHGASDWPVPGLQDLDRLVSELASGGADAIVAQKGVISHLLRAASPPSIGLVAHLSMSTRHGGADAGEKVTVGDVDEVLARGAHAVSAQVNMGTPGEGRMIERLGSITSAAFRSNVPALGMVYARGEHLNVMEGDLTQGQAHAVRLAFELGCNVAKAAWSGSVEAFRQVTSAAPIPVLVAGGPRGDDDLGLLQMISGAMEAGGAGVCMGRQIFAHPSPERLVRAIHAVVHLGASAEEAATHLEA